MSDLSPLDRPLLPGLAASLPASELSLLDLADRLLNRGVVVAGEATVSVAGIDLIYLGLNLVLASVETMQERSMAGEGGESGARRTPGPLVPATAPPAVPTGEEPPPAAPSIASTPNAAGDADRASDSIPAPVDAGRPPASLDLDPDRMEEGLARLVLTLVELIRQLLERQAIRRMEGGSLSDADVERLGLALLRLRDKLLEMAAAFGLQPEDLNIDLGPLGNLL